MPRRTPARTGLALLLSASSVACGGTSEPPNGPAATAVVTTTSEAVPTATAAVTSTPEAATPPPKLDLAAAAKRYVDEAAAAWSTKDAKRLTALYAPDGVMAMPGPKGFQEATTADIEKQLARYFSAFADLKLTYTRVLAQGDTAVAEWVFTGTNTGEFMGQKATQKKTGYKGASVIRFGADGKVKREHVYFDAGTMAGQLGIGPKGQPVRPVEALPTAAVSLSIAGDPAASDAPFRAWLTANEKGDAKAVVALAADDVVISSQYMPADTTGKKALEKELSEAMKAFVDQKNTVSNCVAVSDFVACEYAWQATWKGPAMNMKPTGKTGTVHSLEVGKFKDGKLTHAVAYANGVEFAASFGLMDDKGKAPEAKAGAKKP